MKNVILFLILSLTAFGNPSETTESIGRMTAALDAIEGRAVYESGSPGRFYLLTEYVLNWCSDEDIQGFLEHESVVVRLLGYQCALLKEISISPSIEEALFGNTAAIDYFPYGCVGIRAEIGEIAKIIKSQPTLIIEGPPEHHE